MSAASYIDNDPPSVTSAVLYWLAIVALIWYCVLWSVGLLGCWSGRKLLRLRPRSPLSSATSAPGVSILRPLKGLDSNLFENLESTFKQEYPNYELLLSVSEPDDQALSVVRNLIEKYPNVDARIIIGDEDVGANPKVNNLLRPYSSAKHDILWVIDSNVMVEPGTMARSVDALLSPCSKPSRDGALADEKRGRKQKRRIGIVHHVPYAISYADGPEHSLGSRIEEAFLNTNHAKMYLAINTIAIESCVVGKSNMYRRSDIDRLNGTLKPLAKDGSADTNPTEGKPARTGFAAFGRFLAEDNMIASALWHELDLRHALGCDVAGNTVGHMTFAAYVWRRVRWIRVRKRMVLAATLLEPLTECVAVSLLGAWALRRLFGVPIWVMLILHYTAWIAVDMDVFASLAGYPLPRSRWWGFLSSWALRELLALPIWVLAVVGNDVEWRGRKYTMLKNGEVIRATADERGWFRKVIGCRRRKNEYELVQSDA